MTSSGTVHDINVIMPVWLVRSVVRTIGKITILKLISILKSFLQSPAS